MSIEDRLNQRTDWYLEVLFEQNEWRSIRGDAPHRGCSYSKLERGTRLVEDRIEANNVADDRRIWSLGEISMGQDFAVGNERVGPYRERRWEYCGWKPTSTGYDSPMEVYARWDSLVGNYVAFIIGIRYCSRKEKLAARITLWLVIAKRSRVLGGIFTLDVNAPYRNRTWVAWA